MSPRWRAAALSLGALWAPGLAAADASLTLAELSRGDRVRLRLSSGGETLRGTIEAAETDELVVRRDGSTRESLRLSPQQLAKLEVARGRRSHWLKGAIIGFVPGAVLMGIAVVGTAECDPDCDKTDEVLGYGLLGGAVTGSVGALVGLVIKTDRWVPVRERRPSVALALAPARGGFRAGLSLRF